VHYVPFWSGRDMPFFAATPEAPTGVPRPAGMEQTMFQNFDEMQKITKENTDIAVKNFNTVSKGVQAIAVEVADYSKKSFEQSTAAAEKLFGAKTLDKAIEVQSDYFKTAYEGFVAEATKIGELYTDLAKEAYKPIETAIAKVK
jgi:phasin family protein